jgi:DNA-binding response OmpR family regulator
MIERWGFEVVGARDGREGMTMIEATDFDLLVVDMAMPFMDGFDLVKKVRARLQSKNTPILAVTALDTPEDRDRCLQKGCSDYLPKPFSFDDLKARIEALLAGK